MALILATTYPDVFAAAGVHSATAYRSATQSFRALSAMAARGTAPRGATGEMAPVVLIHGTGDQVVRPTSREPESPVVSEFAGDDAMKGLIDAFVGALPNRVAALRSAAERIDRQRFGCHFAKLLKAVLVK